MRGGFFFFSFSFFRCAHRKSSCFFFCFFSVIKAPASLPFLSSTYRQQALLRRGQSREDDLERGTSHLSKGNCVGAKREKGRNPNRWRETNAGFVSLFFSLVLACERSLPLPSKARRLALGRALDPKREKEILERSSRKSELVLPSSVGERREKNV